MPLLKAHPPARSGPYPRAMRVLHVIVPLVLIAVILSMVGAADVVARLRAANPAWVLAAVIACSAQVILCAVRWRLTAARLRALIPLNRAVGEYYLSSLVNTTVPGGVVGDAMRAVRTRGAAGFETAAQAVVIERLAGQIALGAVLITGLAASGLPHLQWPAAVAALVSAAIAVGLMVLRRNGMHRSMPAVLRRFLGAIRQSWLGGAGPAQATLSLLIVAANIAAFIFAARAAGATLAIADALFAVPLILAAMLIPFSVAGWGYREGAAAAVFPLIGGSAAAGVSASILFGVAILLASLPGLFVLIFQRRQQAVAAETPPAMQESLPKASSHPDG